MNYGDYSFRVLLGKVYHSGTIEGPGVDAVPDSFESGARVLSKIRIPRIMTITVIEIELETISRNQIETKATIILTIMNRIAPYLAHFFLSARPKPRMTIIKGEQIRKTL